MYNRNGLVVMTALPPTLGHKYLINFAREYLYNENMGGKLVIFLCARDGIEPITGSDRAEALRLTFKPYKDENLSIFFYDNPEAPQIPEDHPDFWNWWKSEILKYVPQVEDGILFASDLYGKKLAEVLNCEFIPCNTYREIIDISATKIRNDPINNFHFILPEFQRKLRKTITFFGAESTGKTTFSKLMARDFNGYWVPEWAREYMEVMNLRTVDMSLMDRIMKAQAASQTCVYYMENKPFIFQDTDLLSSLGYYKIAKLHTPKWAIQLFEDSKSDFYILMNDKIPFTPDPLRLGGNVRESSNEFWINLLEEYNCDYYVVKSVYKEDQEQEIANIVKNEFMKHPLLSFKRST